MVGGIEVREALPQDRNFIINSWLNSYYESEFARALKKPLYLRCHAHVVHYLLSKPSVKTLVAASEDLIYGYAVYEEKSPNQLIPEMPVFHYIYVKRAFSHFGVCGELLKHSPFAIEKGRAVIGTHMTFKGEKLYRKLRLTYCPYMI